MTGGSRSGRGGNGNARDAGDGQAQNEQAHNGEETPAPEREETPGDGTEDAAASEDRQQAESENFERDWRVGDGGQVGVGFEDGSLDLLDARPNDEWDVKVDKRSGDEIEVDFSRAEETWGFDAPFAGGRGERIGPAGHPGTGGVAGRHPGARRRVCPLRGRRLAHHDASGLRGGSVRLRAGG